jgi:hypothetical protein
MSGLSASCHGSTVRFWTALFNREHAVTTGEAIAVIGNQGRRRENDYVSHRLDL